MIESIFSALRPHKINVKRSAFKFVSVIVGFPILTWKFSMSMFIKKSEDITLSVAIQSLSKKVRNYLLILSEQMPRKWKIRL